MLTLQPATPSEPVNAEAANKSLLAHVLLGEALDVLASEGAGYRADFRAIAEELSVLRGKLQEIHRAYEPAP